MEEVACKAKNAAKSTHLREVYQLSKQHCGKKRSRTRGIRSKDSKLLIEEGKNIERSKNILGKYSMFQQRQQNFQKDVLTRLTWT